MEMLFTDGLNDAVLKHGVIVYGAGRNGINLLARLIRQFPSVKIEAIVDNDANKQAQGLFGYPVIGFQQLCQAYPKDAIIVVTPTNFALQIVSSLAEAGFTNLVFTEANAQVVEYTQMHKASVLRNRQQLDQLLEENAAKIDFVRSNLQDEMSLNVFNAKMNAIYYGEYLPLEALKEDNQYFASSVVTLSDHEVFVDAGCFDIQTSLAFIKAAGQFRQIIAFECDPIQYEICRAELNFNAIDNFQLINKGLHEKSGILSFESRGWGSSAITDKGGDQVAVTSLDEYFARGEYTPTFIKMDIEGAEQPALRGGKETIQKYHPKLAICVYHGNTDIFEIPYWIKTNFPEYRLFMRQHSNIAETVCYAVV